MSNEITEETLRELFAGYGEVVEIRVVTDQYTGRPKGFAFIDMATEGAAAAAIVGLNEQTVDGRPLRVAEAHPRRRRDTGRDLYTPYRRW
jgi:RNA recognition motif-containing protein